MEKRFLFIITKAPYSSSSARESTDAMMAASAFGQRVSILAIGNGVFQFTKHQDPSALKLKNTSALLESLPLYGTEELFVTREDLAANQLTANDFIIPVIEIDQASISQKISIANIVLNY